MRDGDWAGESFRLFRILWIRMTIFDLFFLFFLLAFIMEIPGIKFSCK